MGQKTISHDLYASIQELSTPVDLVHTCLLIARLETEGLNVTKNMSDLEALAIEAKDIVADYSQKDSPDLEAIVKSICQFLGTVKCFSGNTADYYNPENSYLNEVLLKRKGIPITLGVIYMFIAYRLGLKAEGVGFPGHFLVSIQGGDTFSNKTGDKQNENQVNDQAETFLIDPFNHTLLSREECIQKLRKNYDANTDEEASYLEPISLPEIVIRIIRNLKSIYIQRSNYEKVIAFCGHILCIDSGNLIELLERSYAYEKMGCYKAAREDLELYIKKFNSQQQNTSADKLPANDSMSKLKKKLEWLKEKEKILLH